MLNLQDYYQLRGLCFYVMVNDSQFYLPYRKEGSPTTKFFPGGENSLEHVTETTLLCNKALNLQIDLNSVKDLKSKHTCVQCRLLDNLSPNFNFSLGWELSILSADPTTHPFEVNFAFLQQSSLKDSCWAKASGSLIF